MRTIRGLFCCLLACVFAAPFPLPRDADAANSPAEAITTEELRQHPYMELGNGDRTIPRNQTEADSLNSRPWNSLITEALLRDREAVAFRQEVIPPEVLSEVLRVLTPNVSLSNWRVVVIRETPTRLRLLESMQEAYRRLGREQWARAMERWKVAPVLLAFCMPTAMKPFDGLAPEVVRPMALIELGVGVQGLMVAGRAHGLETHWIASALLLKNEIRTILEIPDDYELVFFGVLGYPSEEVKREFPPTKEICFADKWNKPLDDEK